MQQFGTQYNLLCIALEDVLEEVVEKVEHLFLLVKGSLVFSAFTVTQTLLMLLKLVSIFSHYKKHPL